MSEQLFMLLQYVDHFLAACVAGLALPSTVCFLGVGIYLTVLTSCIQLRGLAYAWYTIWQARVKTDAFPGTISPMRALFTSMASTIGMGNIIGPSVAILSGGPGALLWLIVYMIISGATKYTEVCFAIATRKKTETGRVIGGPMRYLSIISAGLARWYGVAVLLLFALWSSMQSHTLAEILSFHNVPRLLVGVLLAASTLMTLKGGIARVSGVAVQLVPVMFVLYLSCGLYIIYAGPASIMQLFQLIFDDAMSVSAVSGGLLSATLLHSVYVGIQRGVFITEAGLGTSSIAHALARVQRPSQQGVLAMYSIASDALLSLLSGLIVLSAGISIGVLRNTLIYEVFVKQWPEYGSFLFITIALLFVLTTVLGNSFGGTQVIALLAGPDAVAPYQAFTAIAIIAGSVLPVRSLWNLTDILLLCVALPNVIGLIWLSWKDRAVLSLRDDE